MLKRGLLLGLAVVLMLAVSVPSRAALTVRAVVVISTGQAVVLNTPAFTYIPSPGAAPLHAKVVCIKKMHSNLGPGLSSVWTVVHAVKGSKNYYFGMSSLPSASPAQAVVGAVVTTTPDSNPSCNAPSGVFIPSAVGVAVFR